MVTPSVGTVFATVDSKGMVVSGVVVTTYYVLEGISIGKQSIDAGLLER